MRVVVQRTIHADVRVNGQSVGHIDRGLLLLVGIGHEDTHETIELIAKKIVSLRIFEDIDGKMNLSVRDVSGSLLSISQFTLYANCKKGNRPSFIDACEPQKAKELYDYFNNHLREQYNLQVATGIFGASMEVDFINQGPVTIILDSTQL